MKPRFIAAGLDLLGLEGSSYRFFSDPWLAGPTTFRPISPRPADRKIVVSDLINPTSSSWHITTVNSLFLSIDTLLIFSIPLSNLSRKDKGVWFYENSGAYTVRSGYRFTVRQQYSQGSSDSSILNPWSKPLWCTKVSPKIKIVNDIQLNLSCGFRVYLFKEFSCKTDYKSSLIIMKR
ncbi:hypothetical protein ACOSP7_028191 [Xanthoceras sorbifolium]